MNELLLLGGGLWSPEDGPEGDVEKYVFGYPAGKSRMKDGLVKMISPHTTYVEAFCGSAAVFFGKEKSKREVLNDMNKDVIECFKAIQSLTDREAKKLTNMDWTGDRRVFRRIRESKPGDRLGKLHKFLYLAAHSYGLDRRSFNPNTQGHKTGIAQRALKERERLKGVILRNASYETVVKEFDGKDTFFFFDPPYPGYDVNIGEKGFDEKLFVDVLKSIKGRFIVTYGVKGKADFTKFNVQRVAQWRSISSMRGVNRDKVLGTLVITNFKGPAYKAFGDDFEVESPKLIVDMAKYYDGYGGGDSGTHSHVVDRKKKETANDGSHSHLFSLEGGTVLYTIHDGPHVHKLSDIGANKTSEDGAHKHKVRLMDGTTLETDESGAHSHEIMSRGRTSMGGIHTHKLKLPSGTVITSLTSGEVEANTFKSDPYLEVPVDGEKRIATLKGRFVDDKFFGDLWIENGEHSVGWALHLQKEGYVAKSDSVADEFTIAGSRSIKTLSRSVVAEQLGKIDHGIHKLDGDVEGGAVIHVDACYVEHGMHSADAHEYFLSKGRELFGVLRIQKSKREGWLATLHQSNDNMVPDVLRWDNVEKGVMPPEGVSAIPERLMEIIPSDLQFWTMKGEAAREARDMLAASQFLGSDSVELVFGELRKVVRTLELYEPSAPVDLDPEWPLRKLDEHHESASVKERFSTDEPVEKSSVAFYDLTTFSPEEVETQLSVLKGVESEFAISCLDSPEAREAMSKHGRPFRFCPEHPSHLSEVCKRIFVTSFPLSRTDDVQWLDKEHVSKPFAGFETFGDCVSNMIDGGKSEEQARKICGSLQAETEKSETDEEVEVEKRLSTVVEILSKKDEERIVTGIVLEPETVDSQKDIYSEDEIRKAAFGFVEEFQNMGLMHRKMVTGKVRLVESFIARSAFTENGQKVKKGTWVMSVRVIDDKLWKSVKANELTGFSIGGSAVRVPEK